jgi:hypothetical protein
LQLLEKARKRKRRKRESIGGIITITIAGIEMILRTPRTSGDISGEGEKMLMNTEAADQTIVEGLHLQKSDEKDSIGIGTMRERGVEIRLRQCRDLLLENGEDPFPGNDDGLLLRNGEDPLIAGSHIQQSEMVGTLKATVGVGGTDMIEEMIEDLR